MLIGVVVSTFRAEGSQSVFLDAVNEAGDARGPAVRGKVSAPHLVSGLTA